MPRFTDEQVDAAGAVLYNSWPAQMQMADRTWFRAHVIDALTAAADAAPAVDTTEFEAALDNYDEMTDAFIYSPDPLRDHRNEKRLADRQRLIDLFREAAR